MLACGGFAQSSADSSGVKTSPPPSPLSGPPPASEPADNIYRMENCRVLLVGDRGVGKTSLIRRFLGEEFQQVSQSVFILIYIVYYIV